MTKNHMIIAVSSLVISTHVYSQQLSHRNQLAESYFHSICIGMLDQYRHAMQLCQPNFIHKNAQTVECRLSDDIYKEYQSTCIQQYNKLKHSQTMHDLAVIHYYLFADNNYARSFKASYKLTRKQFSRYQKYADFITTHYLLQPESVRKESEKKPHLILAFIHHVMMSMPDAMRMNVSPQAGYDDWFKMFKTIHLKSKTMKKLASNKAKQRHQSQTQSQLVKQKQKPLKKPFIAAGLKLDWDLMHKSRNSAFQNKRINRGYIGLAQASVTINPTNWLSAYGDVTYSESAETGSKHAKPVLDQAEVTLENLKKFPLYLTVGRTYFPFGMYIPFSFIGTVTQNMSGFHSEGALLGYSRGPLYVAAYTFAPSGNINNERKRNLPSLNNYGFEIGITSLAGKKDYGYHFNATYVSDYNESSVMSGLKPSNIDTVGAYSLHASYHYHWIGITSELLQTIGKYNADAFEFNGHGAHPLAWTTTLYAHFKLWKFPSVASVGYGLTDDALAFSQPKHEVILSLSTDISKYVSFESFFSHGRDYSTRDSTRVTTNGPYATKFGTGRIQNAIGLRLSLALGNAHVDMPNTN